MQDNKKASRKRGLIILVEIIKYYYQPVLFVRTAVTAPVVVVVPDEISLKSATYGRKWDCCNSYHVLVSRFRNLGESPS